MNQPTPPYATEMSRISVLELKKKTKKGDYLVKVVTLRLNI